VTIPLSTFERHVVVATRAFANLSPSDTNFDRRAGRVFQPFMRDWMPDPDESAITIDLGTTYRELHPVVFGWFDQIIAARGRRPTALVEEVAAGIQETVSASVSLSAKGQLNYDYEVATPQAVCAFGVALILDPRRGLATRLARCRWSKCGRFVLDDAPAGRPRKFCNDDHARRFDAEDSKNRQAQFRKRHAKEKRHD
jgi:hypothetical protein